jgi:mannonate dehydratase
MFFDVIMSGRIDMHMLEQTMRWFGPGDQTEPWMIRQCGSEGVMTSLHHIPYGEVWPLEEIEVRKRILTEAGLRWSAVESLPVHEDIKLRRGSWRQYVDAYKISLENLGRVGVPIVIYNFMPVLDWVRTDLRYVLPDGSEAMRYDPVHFAAFDVFILKRPGAQNDHPAHIVAQAQAWLNSLDREQIEAFTQTIVDVFPGTKLGYTVADIQGMLAKYNGIDTNGLKDNLRQFLAAVVPVAAEAGVRMAVHPDDPPFPILGLPRIVSTIKDYQDIVDMCPWEENGFAFCTGSLSARRDNALVAMAQQFANRIHAAHFRSTHWLPDGSFYEADHLGASVDMAGVLEVLLEEQERRRLSKVRNWRIPFRPDHGHRMLDDLAKPQSVTPGYSLLGRMRGLAEIRGLQAGLLWCQTPKYHSPKP